VRESLLDGGLILMRNSFPQISITKKPGLKKQYKKKMKEKKDKQKDKNK
jgi:hypothetical protein